MMCWDEANQQDEEEVYYLIFNDNGGDTIFESVSRETLVNRLNNPSYFSEDKKIKIKELHPGIGHFYILNNDREYNLIIIKGRPATVTKGYSVR